MKKTSEAFVKLPEKVSSPENIVNYFTISAKLLQGFCGEPLKKLAAWGGAEIVQECFRPAGI